MQRLPDRLSFLIVVFLFACIGRAHAAPAPLLPSVTLTDETGRQVRLDNDLGKGQIVVMNFIFTSCTTICQPMSATFAQVQPLLGSRPVRLVSVTIDPETDTPERLAAWKAKFHGNASWTLLTGAREEIDRLRKALGVFTADRLDHTPTIVIIDDIHGRSTRMNGLTPARAIVSAIDTLLAGDRAEQPRHSQPSQPSQPSAQRVSLQQSSPQPRIQRPAHARGAGTYFQGLSLVDQTGRHVDLYADIIKDHVVVIHSFFASCEGSCPVIVGKLGALQARFADRLGRDLRFVSITVDPGRDTPQRLRDYAAERKARDGWIFLTGAPDAVTAALKKLGQYAETPEAHTNVLIVGNDTTGLWKKMFGLSQTESLGDVVQSVLDDKGAGTP